MCPVSGEAVSGVAPVCDEAVTGVAPVSCVAAPGGSCFWHGYCWCRANWKVGHSQKTSVCDFPAFRNK